jgi:hypothetical protein
LHDISWGYFKVPLMASETNKHGQYILSQGLPLLQELVSATSFDARRTILRFGKVPDSADDGPPASLPKFMVDRITRLTPGPFLNPVAFLHDVNNMSDQSRERLRWPAFNPDPDPGPVSLWEWVHFGSMGFVGIYMVHQLRHFRQWGYLLWDMSRLRCLDVFRPGWEDEGKSPSDLFTPYWEYDIVSLELSWHRRRKFWEAGKRGYWEAGDENLGVLPGEE